MSDPTYYAAAAAARITAINGQATAGDRVVLSPAPGQTSIVVSSITGQAWASNLQELPRYGQTALPADTGLSWNARIARYALLFWKMTPAARWAESDPTMKGVPAMPTPAGYAIHVCGAAVGVGDVDADGRPVRNSGTPGELMPSGTTLTLPAACYWLTIGAWHRWAEAWLPYFHLSQWPPHYPWQLRAAPNAVAHANYYLGSPAGTYGRLYASNFAGPFYYYGGAGLAAFQEYLDHIKAGGMAAWDPGGESLPWEHYLRDDEVVLLRVNDTKWRSTAAG